MRMPRVVVRLEHTRIGGRKINPKQTLSDQIGGLRIGHIEHPVQRILLRRLKRPHRLGPCLARSRDEEERKEQWVESTDPSRCE